MARQAREGRRISDALLDEQLAGQDPSEVFRDGGLELEVPRDHQGRFEPQLVEKYARRLPGFDDNVISMYACGSPAPHRYSVSGYC